MKIWAVDEVAVKVTVSWDQPATPGVQVDEPR